jgi:hypothetical protein
MMRAFLERAAAELGIEVVEKEKGILDVVLPTRLASRMGRRRMRLTEDRTAVALDPDLDLLAPAAPLTIAISEELRFEGPSLVRTGVRLGASPQMIAQRVSMQSGSRYLPGRVEVRPLLRVLFRVRVSADLTIESLHAVVLDLETGEAWPSPLDASGLLAFLHDDAGFEVTAAHVETALAGARHWLEPRIYPRVAEAINAMSFALAAERKRIADHYESLREDPEMAFGGEAEPTPEDWARLAEEEVQQVRLAENRLRVKVALEQVSFALLWTEVLFLDLPGRRDMGIFCPVMDPPFHPSPVFAPAAVAARPKAGEPAAKTSRQPAARARRGRARPRRTVPKE